MNMMWSKEYNLHKRTHEYDVVRHNKSIRSFYLWLRAACPRPSALRANNNCLSVSAEIVVQMVDEVFDAHGLLEVFQEDVWVPLVLGLMHDVKELSPVIAMLGDKGPISFQTNFHLFKKIIVKYDCAILAYVSKSVRKDQTILHQMVAAGNSAGPPNGQVFHNDRGRDCWLADAFGANRQSSTFEGLDPRSKATCKFLQDFADQLAVRKCLCIFESDILSVIKQRLKERRAVGFTLTWPQVKFMVKHRLPDDSPRMILESLVTMVRPEHMAVSEWTNVFTLMLDLLWQKGKHRLPPALAFSYWSGQVTIHEWELSGIIMPRTTSQMESFDISAFGRSISQMNPRVFPHFKKPFVERYSKKLLVHPSKVIPVVTPGSKNSLLKLSRDDGPGGKGKPSPPPGPLVTPTQPRAKVPYQCFDCGFVHELSKHSAEGLCKIKARYATKLVAQPGACHHCGKLGNFSRSCPQK